MLKLLDVHELPTPVLGAKIEEIVKQFKYTVSSLDEDKDTDFVLFDNHVYFGFTPQKIEPKQQVPVLAIEQKQQIAEPLAQPKKQLQVIKEINFDNDMFNEDAPVDPFNDYQALKDMEVVQNKPVVQPKINRPRRDIKYQNRAFESTFIYHNATSMALLTKSANQYGLDLTFDPKKEYGHPFLRTSSDLMQKASLRNLRSSLLVDIGSKYHRFFDRKFRTNQTDHVYAYRPDVSGQDQIYHQLHEQDLARGITLIKDFVNSETEVYPEYDAIATDCVYYPGVLDYLCEIKLKDSNAKCVGSHIQFPVIPGEYDVIGEGYVVVDTDSQVTFFPKDNGSSYTHKNFIMDPYRTRDVTFTYKKASFMLREVARIQYNSNVAQIAWELHKLNGKHEDTIINAPQEHQLYVLDLHLTGQNEDMYHQLQTHVIGIQSVVTTAQVQAPNYMIDLATGILVDVKGTLSIELLIATVPQLQREVLKTNSRFMSQDSYTQNLIASALIIAHYRKTSVVVKKHQIYSASQEYSKLSNLKPLEPWTRMWVVFQYVCTAMRTIKQILTGKGPNKSLLMFISIVIWLSLCFQLAVCFPQLIPAIICLQLMLCPIFIPKVKMNGLMRIIDRTAENVYQYHHTIDVDQRYSANEEQPISNYSFSDVFRKPVKYRNLLFGSLTNLHPDPKVKPEMYDMHAYNDDIIRKFEIYTPQGERITDDLYSKLKPYCTCLDNQLKTVGKYLIDSDDYKTYQYGSCPLNAVSAIIGRQGSTLLKPHPEYVKDFLKFSRKEIDKIQMIDLDVQTNGWDAYYAHVKSKSIAKAKAYQIARDKFLVDGKIRLELETFPKVGEKFRAKESNVNSQSNRPRNICNPSDTVKAIGGHMNWILLKILKKHFPQFIHGVSCDELAKKIKEKVDSNPTLIVPTGTDGSNHDSHQDADLLKVDVYFIEKFYPLIYSMLQLPDQHFETCKILYNQIDIPVKTYWKKKGQNKRSLFFKFVLHGTVCSGHPLRTTLGNTLRVILYTLYVQYLSNTKFDFFVSGDDCYALLPEKYKLAYEEAFWRVYSPVKFGTHGLGQCAKKLDFLPSNHIDFLSKIGSFTNDVHLDRNLDRMVFLQSYTDSKQDNSSLAQAQVDALNSCAPNLSIIREFVKAQDVQPQSIDMLTASYDIQCHHQNVSSINHYYPSTVSLVGDRAGKYNIEDVDYLKAIIMDRGTAHQLAWL